MIAVTGASGFVGRRLATVARSRFPDADLACYATREDSDYERRGKAFLQSRAISFTEADLVTGDGLVKTRETPRVVFHLAANSDTGSRDYRCNDVGTRNLIRSLKGLGPGSHVVFTSSIAVADNRQDYQTPITEETNRLHPPLTEYGASKLRAEQWLQEEARRVGFSLTIVRPVTVYGLDARPNTLFKVLVRLVLRRSVLARLDWPGLTGLIHVDDVVDILFRLAEHAPPPGSFEIYFAQAEALSLSAISRMVHEHLDLEYLGIRLPRWFWRILGRGLCLVLRTKVSLLARTQGRLWRLRLLAENVFWCDPGKLRAAVPEWQPTLLKHRLGEALN